MSSERRVVRPYVGVDRFQHLLAGFRARIGPEILEPGDRRTMSSSSFCGDPLRLIAANEEHLEKLRDEAEGAATDLGLDPGSIDFVVLASTPYLRLLDVVYRKSLDDRGAIPAETVFSTSEVPALQTPSGGLDLEVCFILNSSLAPQPLRPYRKGTWLGRVRFELRTELGELGFTPQALTAERRRQFGLRDEAVRFIAIDWDAMLEEDMSEAVNLYLDETLLTLLNNSPNTPGARTLQRQLFMDVMAAIVRAVGREDIGECDLAEVDGTVLGRVIDAAAGVGPKKEPPDEKTKRREAAFKQLKNEPEVFLAHLEASAAPREDLRQTITGPEE